MDTQRFRRRLACAKQCNGVNQILPYQAIFLANSFLMPLNGGSRISLIEEDFRPPKSPANPHLCIAIFVTSPF